MFTDNLGYNVNGVQCLIMEPLELIIPLGPIAQLKNTSTQSDGTTKFNETTESKLRNNQ